MNGEHPKPEARTPEKQCSWGCDISAGVRNPSCTVHGADSLPSNERLTRDSPNAALVTREMLWVEIERLTRELGTEKSGHLLTQGERNWALQERDRLRAGLELIGGRDTPEGLIARETLAGRGPRAAPETAARPATEIDRICNAYESGFGRGLHYSDPAQPYAEGCPEARAYLNGYMLARKRVAKETSA